MFCKDKQIEDASPKTSSPNYGNKSFLTPCRRMGLKRKSPASISHKPNIKQLAATNEEGSEIGNSCDPSEASSSKFDTPKRRPVFSPPTLRNAFSSQSDELTHSLISSPETSNSSVLEESRQLKNTVVDSTCDNIYSLKKRIAEKEKNLHCLKQAVIYRKKHDITKLAEMTLKWKMGCQDALHELLIESKKRGFELNMEQLLNQLRIPHELIGYNKNVDEFE